MEAKYYNTEKRFLELVQIASSLSGFSKDELFHTRKHPNIIWRFSIILTLRNEGHTYPNIAAVFRKSHATIIHSCEAMRDAIMYNPSSEYARIWKMFNSTVTEPLSDKRFVTSTSQIESWLTDNNVPEELIGGLMKSVQSIAL